jgi:hypothetical protein
MADVTIPLCACGCGLPAAIAKKTQRGVKKGNPCRFHVGHHAVTRVYRVRGRRRLHRLRAEAALGHPLPPKAQVHHPDNDPWNANARLVICPDYAYHALLHQRERVLRAGGNPNTDVVCSRCRLPKPRDQFSNARRRDQHIQHSYLCKMCDAAVKRARLVENKAHINALRRKRRAERKLVDTK